MTLIAYEFPNLQTAKDLVPQMSKKRPSRTPFNSSHVKGSQTPIKPALQNFYHSFSSL